MQEHLQEERRETPVIGEYDVVVVGGGPAGLMAAAAAAREGRSTVLVERYGFLGGAGTMGGLSTFCGLHARVRGEHRRVVRGYTDELLDRLERMDGLSAPHLSVQDRIQAQAFDISAYKVAADEFLAGSGADLLFHATAVGAVRDAEDRIEAVLVESKSGRAALRGRVFIDGSGDADLVRWAGAPVERSAELLYPSLMFRINGVDPEAAGEAWRTVARLMDEAEESGRRTFPRKKPIVRPQRNPLEWRANLTQLSNPDGSAVDGTDVWQLSHGELQGRRQVWDVFGFIRDSTPGFEDAYVVDIAPQIGIRETYRSVGAYQLSERDILDCVDFEDTVGVQGWPVEAHVEGTVEFRFPPAGLDSRGFNQLPYRMLVPQGVRNLLTVGRSASMTQWGQSSARVTGPCFVMGQAAGVAAHLSLAAGVGVADVHVPDLQHRLEETGAYLGTDLPPDPLSGRPAGPSTGGR
ncbi:FAD-dependent oxidoreductase [Citricoccus sp. I39-566]|uniref:FAD-dependent oxidoreductase n=1 Tax=Citricoccus sp. I39-566 TaxID=3073268 RepID=UPI00286C7554|nr:FAD-dependent oxidoreductase [Citricoccus sp. I39-566]WMY79340.1 FAD-dependent oxidoreductase [Citricoccus sp. I39-566]